MKKITTLLSILLATYSFAQDCAQGRYKDEIFSTVNKTSNIQYGSNDDKNGANVNLSLDVYQPDGDTITDRALIIMAHGGSFIGGSKTGSDVVDLCNDLAKKGYVVASIDYRIGMNGIPFPGPDSADATETVFRAVQDGRAAVRFFRKDFVENANSYGIDSSQIYFAGVSAGGFIALHLAYLDEMAEFPSYVDTVAEPGLTGGLEGNSGNAGYSSKVVAIVNIAGALGDRSWATAGSTPCLSLHGNQDGTVPYNTDILYMSGIFEIMVVDGSSSVATQLDAVGVNNCYKEFNGADHVPHVNSQTYYDTTLTYMTGFLAQFTCGDPFTCSDATLFTSINKLNASHTVFDVYPNPATNFITVKSGLLNEATIEIFDLLGKRVYFNQSANSTEIIDVSNLKSGQYVVKLSDDTGSVSQKMVIE
ncbi:MAG: T9SS type A sorting domain-containing protein [Flavobacteriales bacterium]|nr:T9SS type A sorting domain-containing protein [Flavobacteriales bacterium]